MIRLNREAKRVGIDFVPHQVMLDSLLNSVRLLQHKLDKINGFNGGILDTLGIPTNQTLKQGKQQQLHDEEAQLLFKT